MSTKEVLKKIYREIMEAAKEPAYQHEDEDWIVGLMMASDIVSGYISNCEE